MESIERYTNPPVPHRVVPLRHGWTMKMVLNTTRRCRSAALWSTKVKNETTAKDLSENESEVRVDVLDVRVALEHERSLQNVIVSGDGKRMTLV